MLWPGPTPIYDPNLIQDAIVDGARLPCAHLTFTNRRVLIMKSATLSLFP
jgi:hypothetical protein